MMRPGANWVTRNLGMAGTVGRAGSRYSAET